MHNLKKEITKHKNSTINSFAVDNEMLSKYDKTKVNDKKVKKHLRRKNSTQGSLKSSFSSKGVAQCFRVNKLIQSVLHTNT